MTGEDVQGSGSQGGPCRHLHTSTTQRTEDGRVVAEWIVCEVCLAKVTSK